MLFKNLNSENLISLFASIVNKYPNNTAIKDCTKSLTYLELFQQARLIAAKLLEKDIASGDRIICMSKKDTESIICFWGILLAGGIPVMLDSDEELKSNETKIKVIQPRLIILDIRNISLTTYLKTIELVDIFELLDTNCSPLIDLSKVLYPSTCYLLLTSGTTGIPKAVQVSHANVLHYTRAIYKRLKSPEKINSAHLTTFSADLGHTNIFLALISGGMLRIVNKEEATDPALFCEFVKTDKISLLKITPSHLTSLISEFDSPSAFMIDNIILGGEKLSWEVVKRLFSLKICSNLFNHYGPTETTIGATVYKIETSSEHFNRSSSVPIGSPLGEGICFLNQEQDEIGELYIAGSGVSQGYLNNEEENRKKFMVQEIRGEENRCYCTGDICKLHPDGNYEFLYRSDRQVKIRGYRIELGEIEVLLSTHPKIENVNVDACSVDDRIILSAYIKLVKGEILSQKELREWLSERASTYKIPSNLFFYNKTVYTSNGKIDLQFLKNKFKNSISKENKADIDLHAKKWEVVVEQLWKNILNKKKISESDNFFEIGGDSLMSILLIGRLQRYGYKVHIKDLTANSVYGSFKRLNLDKINGKDIRKPIDILVNLFTYSQYVFLKKNKFDLDNYRQSILFETNKKIDIRKFGQTLNYILERHEQLNTAFSLKDGRVNSNKKAWLETHFGFSVLNENSSKILQIQSVVNKSAEKFSIEKGNLFYFHLFTDIHDKDYLYLSCHHIAIDVISWNILINELIDVYESILKGNTPKLISENSVSDYFNELNLCNIKKTQSQPELRKKNEKIIKLPNLIQEEDLSSRVYTIGVPEEFSKVLKGLDDKKNCTSLSGYLLRAFGKAIFHEFKISEISIDIESHGRPQEDDLPDISNSVSWWATTTTLNLNDVNLDAVSCSELVKEIAEYANTMNINRNRLGTLHIDLSDIRFNYLGNFLPVYKNSSIELIPSVINPGSTRSKEAHQEYQLYFTSRFIGNEFVIDIQYQQEKFSRLNIVNLVQNFLLTLKESIQEHKNNINLDKVLHIEGSIPSVGQPLTILNKMNAISQFISKKKVYFITGVTGFLGIYLFHNLIKNEQSIIFCLVRGHSQAYIEKRLKETYEHFFGSWSPSFSNRVFVIKGDLELENFGISKEEYEIIEKKTDIIIHTAADINLIKDYKELKATNIYSTVQLVKLAKTDKDKELHYISTLAVSGFSKEGIQRNFSEYDFDYGQNFVSDYEKTKFEAEKIVREFQNQKGKGKIYRVGHIAANSFTGKFQMNIEHNRIFQILSGIILLRQIPIDYQEKISFSNVDIVAKAITTVGVVDQLTPMSCLHLENPHYVNFSVLVESLNDMGYNIVSVDMDTFKNTVATFSGTDNDEIVVSQMNHWIKRSLDFSRNLKYEQHHSIDTLAQFGIYFPHFDTKWFQKMICEGISAGYFKKLGRTSKLFFEKEFI